MNPSFIVLLFCVYRHLDPAPPLSPLPKPSVSTFLFLFFTFRSRVPNDSSHFRGHNRERKQIWLAYGITQSAHVIKPMKNNWLKPFFSLFWLPTWFVIERGVWGRTPPVVKRRVRVINGKAQTIDVQSIKLKRPSFLTQFKSYPFAVARGRDSGYIQASRVWNLIVTFTVEVVSCVFSSWRISHPQGDMV